MTATLTPEVRVTLEGAGSLEEGDAVRFTAAGGQRVTADEPAEVLVWEMTPPWAESASTDR